MNTTDPILDLPLDRLMLFAALGVMAIVTLFIFLAIVRYLSAREAKKNASAGGLDLDALRREHEAGNLTDEEFAAIRDRLACALSREKRLEEAASATPEVTGDQPEQETRQ